MVHQGLCIKFNSPWVAADSSKIATEVYAPHNFLKLERKEQWKYLKLNGQSYRTGNETFLCMFPNQINISAIYLESARSLNFC